MGDGIPGSQTPHQITAIWAELLPVQTSHRQFQRYDGSRRQMQDVRLKLNV